MAEFTAPNLDAMSVDDLLAFRKTAKMLVEYADNKITAIRFRSRGQTNTALLHEKQCDQIYAQLPYDVKW